VHFKKHISLFLALTFLVSNLGMAFTVHFCDNEIKSVSVNIFQENDDVEKSCCGEIEKESNCCDTTIIKAENSIDKQVIGISNYLFPVAVLPENTFLVFPVIQETTIQKNKTLTTVKAHAPPLYKLYCSLIFYC